MILVRNVFRLKYGKAKEAKALWQEARALGERLGAGPTRAYADVTGPFYTFVLEGTYASLAAFEESAKAMSHPEWKAWHEKYSQLVDSGYREILTLVE